MGNSRFRLFSLCAFFGLLMELGPAFALADDGFYFQSFNPVQQTQIDAALASMEKFGLERVVLFPDPAARGGENLEVRWKLLKAAAQQDARLVVPSLEEVKATKNGQLFTALPLQGKYRSLTDSRSQSVPIPTALKGQQIFVVERGLPLEGKRAYVRVLNSPDQERKIRAEIAMEESLLPSSVAKIIKAERLYGHSGKRGYYGLPESVTKQIDFEQRLNDRLENKETFASILDSDLAKEFYPEQRPTFKLFNVDVPLAEVTTLVTGRGGQDFLIEKNGQKFVRFFVHPESEKLFRKSLSRYEWRQDYWATPTSSHRSLIVWDPLTQEAPFGVKSTLDATIGDSLRHLNRGQVERAAATSALINTLDSEAMAKKGILFIDEPLGVYLRKNEKGYALRNLPILADGKELMPMFSLYSKPFGSPPPIVEMVKASGLSAREFAEKQIIAPLVNQAGFLAWEHGMVGEPHEQNLLLELDRGKPTGRVYYRDLAGFILNPKLREASGKDMKFLPEGILASSLKPEYSLPIENALNYLRLSNFYAMKKALAPYYPEITDKWVDETFREYMRQNVKKYTGVDSLSITDWRRAYRDRVSGKSQECAKIFDKFGGKQR